MKPRHRTKSLVLMAVMTLPASAHALESPPESGGALQESTRGPFYVQGVFGSGAFWAGLTGGGDEGYWHPEVEIGYHLTGRHDGVVLGLRQGFEVGASLYSIGETSVRGGYDIAVPLRNGRFELTLAPFATVGLDYLFRNVNAGFRWSVGVDAKLFFFRGLYLVVRPFELGGGEFVSLGRMFFNFNAGAGVGIAF